MTDYKNIKLVILDVDGTLTDGGIYYDSHGEELKKFNLKDGLGIKVATLAGLEFAIITGRKSAMVERRAKELKIAHLMDGVQQKYPAMLELVKKTNMSMQEVCYIGDDWNDLQCMKSVGLSMCPADAAVDILEISDYVAKAKGGHGAVRECLEYILKKRNVWAEYCLQLYEVK